MSFRNRTIEVTLYFVFILISVLNLIARILLDKIFQTNIAFT
jgi:hypothetical protein